MITIAHVELSKIGRLRRVNTRDEPCPDLSRPEFKSLKHTRTSHGFPVFLVDPPDDLPREYIVTEVETLRYRNEDAVYLWADIRKNDNDFIGHSAISVKDTPDLILIHREV